MKYIYIKNDEDEINKLEVSTWAESFAEENNVPDIPGSGTAAEFVENMVEMAKGGQDYEWGDEPLASLEGKDEAQEAFELVKDAVGESDKLAAQLKSQKDQEKEAKKKEREEAKKKKEEEEAALAERRDSFLQSATKGVEKADKAFKTDLESLKKGLPKHVSVAFNDAGGFGIDLEEGATETEVGEAMGFLTRREENNSFLKGALQFLVGDLANKAKAMGIYKSMIKAGAALSDKVFEATGRRISGKNIESYARMAERCPVDMRNPMVSPTLYLKVSDAKLPKREEGEKKDDYQKRVEQHTEDRNKIFEAIKEGKIEDKEGNEHVVESIKDVQALVEQLQVKHKIKTPKDPNQKSVGDYLKQFFLASNALDNLIGIHEADVAIFADENGEDEIEGIKVTKYTTGELTDLVEEAKTNLENAFYTKKDKSLAEFMEGTKKTSIPVLVEDEKSGKEVPKKDEEGNPVTKEVSMPVFPPNFFAAN